MKMLSITKFALMLSLAATMGSAKVFALTDEEALADGMTPAEDYIMGEMKAVLTPELSANGVMEAVRRHRLVIAVNKKASGNGAQVLTMYENGTKILEEKISTGRERMEKAVSGRRYFSTTPKGFFRPTNVYTSYHSHTWNAALPNAVFFIGGIAVHATSKSHYKELGTRASGGCVRTTLEISKFVREKVMDTGRGSQPGQYSVVTESKGRFKVTNNGVMVDKIDRNTGNILNGKINSWDTVIIVYEE